MVYKNLLFCLITTLLATTAMGQQDLWVQRDSIKGPGKSASTAFAIGLKGFVGMGLSDDGFKRSLYEYDPIKDDWDKNESLGGSTGDGLERATPVSFVVKNKAYIGLGNGNDPYFRDFWEYDPATDSWTQKADFGGTGRRQAVAFAIDSFGYVGTGLDVTGYKADFWKYDVGTNTWTAIADFAGGNRKQAVGFSMADKGYVGTGESNTGYFKDFWEYNPSTDTWTAKASFPGTARYGATAVADFPDAIVGLGFDNTLNYKADLWRYNANTNAWVQLADFPGGARSNAIGFVIQKHAYIGAGYNGYYLDDFYEYNTLISVHNIADKTTINTRIYPNPAQMHCTIELDKRTTEVLTVEIYNTLGQQVNNTFGIQQTDYQQAKFQLNTSYAPDGIYFYAIKENGQQLTTGQLIVSKG